MQKVRGVSIRQFLCRLWHVRCVNMRLSLCLIFWNTQETILIVATRRVISFNLQQNLVQDQNGPFLIYWVLGMFGEQNDDHSVFFSVVDVQILLAHVVPLSVFVALGVLLLCTVSALRTHDCQVGCRDFWQDRVCGA